jgi:hypothetical protein
VSEVVSPTNYRNRFKIHQEWQPGERSPTGRDPATMTVKELAQAGHQPRAWPIVARTKCLDCCAGDKREVRLCAIADCALWPYRLGTDPFPPPASPRRERTPAQQAVTAANLDRIRAARAGGVEGSKTPPKAWGANANFITSAPKILGGNLASGAEGTTNTDPLPKVENPGADRPSLGGNTEPRTQALNGQAAKAGGGA